jgi:hypothetical protein
VRGLPKSRIVSPQRHQNAHYSGLRAVRGEQTAQYRQLICNLTILSYNKGGGIPPQGSLTIRPSDEPSDRALDDVLMCDWSYLNASIMHCHVIAITQRSVRHGHAMVQLSWLDRSDRALDLGETEACETNPAPPIWQDIPRVGARKKFRTNPDLPKRQWTSALDLRCSAPNKAMAERDQCGWSGCETKSLAF